MSKANIAEPIKEADNQMTNYMVWKWRNRIQKIKNMLQRCWWRYDERKRKSKSEVVILNENTTEEIQEAGIDLKVVANAGKLHKY